MERPDDSLDILGVVRKTEFPVEPASSKSAPQEGTETVVLPGDVDVSRLIVARSVVRITFSSDEDLEKCVAALKASDEEMRQRPAAAVSYKWDRTVVKDRTVHFGVVWYDRDFFAARKEAFKTPQHTGIFAKFGAKPESFSVEHYVRLDE
jgi:hypothetical protein